MFSPLLDQLSVIERPDLFNPYRDYDPEHDRPDGPDLRRRNLLLYLESMYRLRPTTLWLGESGSHTGTRRSGLPLVPTTVVPELNDLFATTGFRVATRTPDQTGMTAGYVWNAALQQPELPLLWNAVMAQPYRPGQPYRNRPVRAAERRIYAPVLRRLLDLFAVRRTVAIGRVAERMLVNLGEQPVYLRHPAQGGAAAFRAGVAML